MPNTWVSHSITKRSYISSAKLNKHVTTRPHAPNKNSRRYPSNVERPPTFQKTKSIGSKSKLANLGRISRPIKIFLSLKRTMKRLKLTIQKFLVHPLSLSKVKMPLSLSCKLNWKIKGLYKYCKRSSTFSKKSDTKNT